MFEVFFSIMMLNYWCAELLYSLMLCSLICPLFSLLGQKHSFTWGPYAAFHGMAWTCHIEGSMITAVWTHLRMFLNSKFHHFRVICWILLKPVLGDVDGNLQFPVPSMNRLNQTEPAKFSILLCWTFFRYSVFLYFTFYCILCLHS
jgi:hypothetical protein